MVLNHVYKISTVYRHPFNLISRAINLTNSAQCKRSRIDTVNKDLKF